MLDGTHFAFDMGANSIGWAVLGLDTDGNPNRIVDSGVRIFSDGREPSKSGGFGKPLAASRRERRGMARRRDRYKRRRKALLRVLAEYGLMPDTREARRALVAETNDRKGGVPQDVYALRARALEEKLPLHHIGRALADDLMEPYRPLVDDFVHELAGEGVGEVTPEAKRRLAMLGTLDLVHEAQTTPLGLHAQRLAHSLATSFELGKPRLSLPFTLATASAESRDFEDA